MCLTHHHLGTPHSREPIFPPFFQKALVFFLPSILPLFIFLLSPLCFFPLLSPPDSVLLDILKPKVCPDGDASGLSLSLSIYLSISFSLWTTCDQDLSYLKHTFKKHPLWRRMREFTSQSGFVFGVRGLGCIVRVWELSGLVAGDSAICGRLAALILRLRPAGLRFEEFRSPVKRGGLGLRFSNRSGLRPAAIWVCGHKPKFRSHSRIGCDFGAGWSCGWCCGPNR